MWLLDTGHRAAPLILKLLFVIQFLLVWPLLYPLALVALHFGFSDPVGPVYWLMPPVNSSAVAFLVAGTHAWFQRRRLRGS